jgi:hypothetical protein
MAGYHVKDIAPGKFGELSKIREEVEEAFDAEEQGNRLMVLVELADIIGAIDGYLFEKYGEAVTLQDLITMSDATRRAFVTGHRKPKE